MPGRRLRRRRARARSSGADAVVLVTEWDEFRDARLGTRSPSAWAARLVIDGRNALDADAVRAAGLAYEGIGAGG